MANELEKIVSITELRRNFGALTETLPEIDALILTKGGEPFALLKAVPAEKKKIWRKAAGAWRKTAIDSNLLWAKVFHRRSRRQAIKL